MSLPLSILELFKEIFRFLFVIPPPKAVMFLLLFVTLSLPVNKKLWMKLNDHEIIEEVGIVAQGTIAYVLALIRICIRNSDPDPRSRNFVQISKLCDWALLDICWPIRRPVFNFKFWGFFCGSIYSNEYPSKGKGLEICIAPHRKKLTSEALSCGLLSFYRASEDWREILI